MLLDILSSPFFRRNHTSIRSEIGEQVNASHRLAHPVPVPVVDHAQPAAVRQHVVLEVVGVGDAGGHERVAVVVVHVGRQAVVGVVGIGHAPRQRRDGGSQRLAVAHEIIGVGLNPVVVRGATDCFRLQVVVGVINVRDAGNILVDRMNVSWAGGPGF